MAESGTKGTRAKYFVAAGSLLALVGVVAASLAVMLTMKTHHLPSGGGGTVSGSESRSVSRSDSAAEVSSDEPEGLRVTSQATVAVTGDLVGHMAILEAAYDKTSDSYQFDNVFTYLKPYASQADYAVANLETTLRGTEDGGVFQGFPRFNTPDSIVDAVMNAGFDMLLTANNHAYDTGTRGMKRTVKVLEEKHIDHIGTVQNPDDKRYLVRDINGISVGMACYSYETTSLDGKSKYLNGIYMEDKAAKLIDTFDYNHLDKFYAEAEQRLAAMREEGAEATVFFLHWGNEYKIKQDRFQKQIAQKLCDMGVDVIVGGHPHMIQPVALLQSADGNHRTVCIYSTGNALANQRRATFKIKTGYTEDGCLFRVTFQKLSDGRVILADTTLLPTWVSMTTDPATKRRVYQIIPLDTSVKDWGEAFGLDKTAVSEAKESYERTMGLTEEGMTEAREYFRQRAEEILNDSE